MTKKRWFTSIAPDKSFWLDKQFRNACIISRTYLYNPLQFFPWQMSQSACFFSVKSSAQLYSDRKPRACQKFGVGPGLDKCPAHGQRKTCKCPTPGTDKADKCPAVAGGGGVLGASGFDWCVSSFLVYSNFPQTSSSNKSHVYVPIFASFRGANTV